MQGARRVRLSAALRLRGIAGYRKRNLIALPKDAEVGTANDRKRQDGEGVINSCRLCCVHGGQPQQEQAAGGPVVRRP